MGQKGFVVFKEYVCQAIDRIRHPTTDSFTTERILITSNSLQAAIHAVARCDPYTYKTDIYGNKGIPTELEFKSPYAFLYHHRSLLFESSSSVTEETRTQILALLDYLEISQGCTYREIDSLLSQGKIDREHLNILFCPNEIIVSQKNGADAAYTLKTWPVDGPDLDLDCWYWEFDGTWLKRESTQIRIGRPVNRIGSVVELQAYPLKYADEGVRARLLDRGRRFWALRLCHFVAYTGWDFPSDQIYVG